MLKRLIPLVLVALFIAISGSTCNGGGGGGGSQQSEPMGGGGGY